MTDTEKQEILTELMALIRAEGLEYGGNTITFPDAFNITQTERQNVKIPAIDERSATPVHGNVDLEALLSAYGLPKVQQIASDISSNYIKKTADSDLNMNGYHLLNLYALTSTDRPHMIASNKIIPIPSYEGGANLFEHVVNHIKQICADYPSELNPIFIGRVSGLGQGMIIIQIYNTSDLSDGIPWHGSGIISFPWENLYQISIADYAVTVKKIATTI